LTVELKYDSVKTTKSDKKGQKVMRKGIFRSLKKKLCQIRSKLVIYYFTFLVIPMAMMILIFNVAIHVMKNSEAQYTMNILSQMNNNISETMNRIFTQSARTAADKSLWEILGKSKDDADNTRREDQQTVTDILLRYLGDMPFIQSVNVLGYNGEIYSLEDGGASLPRDYVFTNAGWYQKMQAFGTESLLVPTHKSYDILAENKENNVITYVREIRKGESALGYLMLEVETGIFTSYIDSAYFKKDSSIIIIDSSNKKVIYHTKPEYINSQFREGYLSQIMGNSQGYLVTDTKNKKEEQEIVAHTTSEEAGWKVIYTLPVKEAYKSIRSLTFMAVYIFILCIPVAIGLAIMVSKNLTNPIFVLRDCMKEVEDGNIQVEIQVQSQDEIGELSISFQKMLEHIRSLIGEVYEKEIHRKQAELNALQAQINPHFLYNTFQIMDIMAEEKEAYELSDACQALSRIFRYSIRKKEEVSLKEEIEHVKNYMYIQNIRFGDRLEVVYDIPGETLNMEIIKLIIQPIVENAIIHGIENQDKVCRISISSLVTNDVLSIIVEDTGSGMSYEELSRLRTEINRDTLEGEGTKKREGGIAMRNVNQRIKLRYGGVYGLYVHSQKQKGTKVILNLPAKKMKDV
jgi:two-component system sensor histidine kinase YesM